MTDQTIRTAVPVDAAPMQRLADRLAGLVPPPAAAPIVVPAHVQPSPAVAAAMAKSAAISAKAARRARPRSALAVIIDSFVSACAFIPYALVALSLRFVMARVFFLDGQSKVDGIRVPVNVQDFDFSVVLPMQVRPETFTAFLTQYNGVPLSPTLAAYLVSYAEFILPIMLLLGLGTRFAAFALLVMTAVIQFYVMPQALWSVHVYWVSILMVLLSLGAGQISIDHIIRYVTRR